jgi:hypothetical protein
MSPHGSMWTRQQGRSPSLRVRYNLDTVGVTGSNPVSRTIVFAVTRRDWVCRSMIMTRTIIITDLTRFAEGKPIVCTAGIDPENGECIRPLPYLPFSEFTRLGMFPGGILKGDFSPQADRERPHVEDCTYEKLQFSGPCSSARFMAVLEEDSSPSLEEGFGVALGDGAKVIPVTTPPARSIITLQVEPQSLEVVEDGYKPGKLRLHFVDGADRSYRYFSVADLGFHDYARRHRESGALDDLNAAISEQSKVYLRIGLGRVYTSQGKEGYWLQANGIYTFPDKLSYIRSYPTD